VLTPAVPPLLCSTSIAASGSHRGDTKHDELLDTSDRRYTGQPFVGCRQRAVAGQASHHHPAQPLCAAPTLAADVRIDKPGCMTKRTFTTCTSWTCSTGRGICHPIPNVVDASCMYVAHGRLEHRRVENSSSEGRVVHMHWQVSLFLGSNEEMQVSP
jgi:hypothetical protein